MYELQRHEHYKNNFKQCSTVHSLSSKCQNRPATNNNYHVNKCIHLKKLILTYQLNVLPYLFDQGLI